MNIRTLMVTATACVATLPAHAAEPGASRQENIGVASGLVVGALAGGPFGAIFGAATGAWLGDRYHRQKAENAALTADLTQSQTERAKLNDTLAQSQTHNEELAKQLEERRELEAQFGFRTGDATLSVASVLQLEKLGALAATMPDMQVRIAGYADPRGSEEFNQMLSKARADAAAAVLSNAGIEAKRLVVEAHGKSAATAAEGDMDGYAMERRVVVRFERTDGEKVAQRT